MKNLFLIMAVISVWNTNGQVSSEQIAFNYFFDNIFFKNYKLETNVIQFSGKTEINYSEFGIYKPCFKYPAFESAPNRSRENSKSIPIDIGSIDKVRIKKSKHKYRLNVLIANKIGDTYYVQIEFTKNKHFTDAYFIKLDDNGQVLDWCKTGIVW